MFHDIDKCEKRRILFTNAKQTDAVDPVNIHINAAELQKRLSIYRQIKSIINGRQHFYVQQRYRQILLRARISYGNSVCPSACLSVTTRYGFDGQSLSILSIHRLPPLTSPSSFSSFLPPPPPFSGKPSVDGIIFESKMPYDAIWCILATTVRLSRFQFYNLFLPALRWRGGRTSCPLNTPPVRTGQLSSRAGDEFITYNGQNIYKTSPDEMCRRYTCRVM